LRKLNFSKWKFLFLKTYWFSFFFNWGHCWLHVDRWCFAVVFQCGVKPWIIFILFYYQSVLCDTSYVLCSIMHSSYLSSRSQSKFPITSCVSFWSSLIPTLFQPLTKCLKPPPSYFPINQWNYFRNPHYRVVTKRIPLTTVVLYVEFIIDPPPPSVVIFHDIH
jgi:hypothetical protein